MITLTEEQQTAINRIRDFFNSDEELLTLGGYAGTGKSTVVAEAVHLIHPKPKVVYCAFTGRAASVLRAKLGNKISPEDYCGTVHGLIYDVESSYVHPETKKSIVTYSLKDDLEADLIVVDEASMIDEDMFEDLQSFGIPILAVGDHFQLPPIGSRINLMKNPDIRLEKIHRQAENDPIIRASIEAREHGRIPLGVYGPNVEKISSSNLKRIHEVCVKYSENIDSSIFLCGKNKTRISMNSKIRNLNQYSIEPQQGDRLICVKNNRREGIYNGMLGVVQEIKKYLDHWYLASILMEDGKLFEGQICKESFNREQPLAEYPGVPKDLVTNQFEFGYACTVHKFQGSEMDNVVLFEEPMAYQSEEDFRRWLYTGCSRAKKSLLIIGN